MSMSERASGSGKIVGEAIVVVALVFVVLQVTNPASWLPDELGQAYCRVMEQYAWLGPKAETDCIIHHPLSTLEGGLSRGAVVPNGYVDAGNGKLCPADKPIPTGDGRCIRRDDVYLGNGESCTVDKPIPTGDGKGMPKGRVYVGNGKTCPIDAPIPDGTGKCLQRSITATDKTWRERWEAGEHPQDRAAAPTFVAPCRPDDSACFAEAKARVESQRQ